MTFLGIAIAIAAAGLAAAGPVPEPDPGAPDTRRILVWASPDASAETLAARDTLLAEAAGAPLFHALALTHRTAPVLPAGGLGPSPQDRAAWRRQGLDNIIVVGTPDEGDVAARTKGFTYGIDTGRQELFRLGFGRFKGDIGVVETGFNPWLYSDRFDDNPYSTLLVRIAGTTPAGVALAARAFLDGLDNGIVLGPGSRRVEESILDRDPASDPPPALPPRFEADGGDTLVFAGWSQVPEQEFRAFSDHGAAHEPAAMWRVKYLGTGVLDDCSGAAWIRGPAPMAWGNSVTVALFDDAGAAGNAWEGIGAACRERADLDVAGHPAFSIPMPVDGLSQTSLGRIAIWAQGRWLVMSSLPDPTHAAVAASLDPSP